jgi:methionine synthase II (cobalamin-independent)
MKHVILEYTDSAFNHGISKEDIYHAINNAIYDEIQESDNEKHLLIGFDIFVPIVMNI